MQQLEPYPDAWRVPSDDPSEYGVLVRINHEKWSYWWLMCPGTATLYIETDPDLRDCQHGGECNYLDDVHRRAHELRKRITASEVER